MGPWDTLHQPDPLQVTPTPHQGHELPGTPRAKSNPWQWQWQVFYGWHRPVCPQQPLELQQLSEQWRPHKLGRSPGREGKPRAPGFLSLHNFRLRPDREQWFLQHFLPSQLGAELLTLLLPKAGSCPYTQQVARGLQWGWGTGLEYEQDPERRAPLSAVHHPALGPQ